MPASCFGPVISFRLIATLNWRWTFYIGILANGLALITVGLFYWPPSFASLHSAGKSRVQQLKELDVVGLFLFAGGLTTFLLGIGWSNNPYSWTSGQVLAPVILGGKACAMHDRVDHVDPIPRDGSFHNLSGVGSVRIRIHLEAVSAIHIQECPFFQCPSVRGICVWLLGKQRSSGRPSLRTDSTVVDVLPSSLATGLVQLLDVFRLA